MKKQKNVISCNLKRVLIIVLVLTIGILTNVYANEITIEGEYSKQYLEWVKLPEEERIKTLQPRAYNIRYKEDIYSFDNRLKLYQQGLRALPTSYLLSDNVVVENQGLTGCCWAFGACSAVETTMSKKYNQDYQLSAAHLEYATVRTFLDGTNTKGLYRTLNVGGNTAMSMPYCMNGTGMILESEMPFSDYSSKIANGTAINLSEIDKDSYIKVTDYIDFPSIFKTISGTSITYKDENSVNYTQTAVTQMRNNIKQHIYNNGGLIASMYYDVDYLKLSTLGTTNIVTSYVPEYIDSNYVGNHQIVIIGWDDNFSKTNFKTQPNNNGAYICLNSHGTLVGTNPIDGYIYIPYDDVYIETQNVGILEAEKTYDKDIIYQHDFYGITYQAVTDSGNVIYGKNVFNKTTTESEYLMDISIGLTSTQTVELYTITNGGTAQKLNVDIGTLSAGYHTIKLSQPIEITSSTFSIIAKCTSSDPALGVESPLTELISNSPYACATSSTGESYVSIDGTSWTDMKTISGNTNSNLCIKAITTTQDPTITEVTLNKTSVNLTIEEEEALIATIIPENAINKAVTWESSNTSIATVSQEGVVTAKALGTATITVTTEDEEKKATCTVNVIQPVTGVTLNKTNIGLKEGETATLVATVSPTNATNKTVSWKSSDTSVVIVNTEGVITAKKSGIATITVTTIDGAKTATCTVTVGVAVTGVTLDKTDLSLKVGKTETLIATVTPENAVNKIVTWKSSNTNVATVNTEGTITAKSPGTAIVTVTTQEGAKIATCTVNVTQPVTGITLNKKTTDIIISEKETLVATITPTNATNKTVTWESSNEEVAIVSSEGVVTAKKVGISTITVKTQDGGKTATCTVNVIQPVTGITLDKISTSIIVGETETLTAIIEPTNATNKKVTWKSSNEEVATVKDGTVTAVSVGVATITATSEDGQKRATCRVIIKLPDAPIDSEDYVVTENKILRIMPNTSKEEFLEKIETEKLIKIIYGDSDIEIGATERISTGMRLKIDDKTYNLVVLGDMNGDGGCNLIDLAKIKLHMISLKMLTGEYLLAADMDASGGVDIIDLTLIKLFTIGLYKIK